MSRPIAFLIAAACLAVILAAGVYIAGGIGRARQAAAVEETMKAGEDAADCARAERELAAAKSGKPVPGAEAELALRLVVWSCRGKPTHPLPAEL